MLGETEFVGRQAEIAAIRRALADELSGGVLVVGTAGVGKTRLVTEALGHPDLRDGVVRVTGSRATSHVPLGAFAELLPSFDREEQNMLGLAHQQLLERSGDGIILFVDDVQWLDAPSCALLLHLVVRGDAAVVLTARSNEPLADAITSLWKDDHIQRLDVRPLRDDDMRELVTAALGGPVDDVLAATLIRLSTGLPLLVEELIDGARRSRTLQRRGDQWIATGPLPIAPGLDQVLGARLAELTDDERALVLSVALAQPLLVDTAVELSDERVVDRLDHLGVLDVRPSAAGLRVWLGHPLYGDLARSAVSASEHRAALSRVCAAMRQQPLAASDELRLAVWLLELDQLDGQLFATSALRAIAAGDFVLAVRLASAIPNGAAFDDDHLAITYLQALADAFLGDLDAGQNRLVRAFDDATSDEDRVTIAGFRATVYHAVGREDLAWTTVTSLEDRVDSPDACSRLRAHRAAYELEEGDVLGVIDALTPVVGSPDPATHLLATTVLGSALQVAGRPLDAIAVAEAAYLHNRNLQQREPLRLLSVPAHPAGHRMTHTCALAVSGYLDEARDLANTMTEDDLDLAGLASMFASLAQGWTSLRRGDIADAAAGFVSARRQHDANGAWKIRTLVGLATGYAVVSAAQCQADGIPVGCEVPLLDDRLLVPLLAPLGHLAAGWTAHAELLVVEAADAFDHACAVGLQIGNLMVAAEAAMALAEIDADRVAQHVAPLRTRVQGPLYGAWLDSIDARTRRDPHATLAAGERLRDLGARRDAAVVFDAANALLAAAGDRRRAAAAGRAVAELRSSEPIIGLTAREADVAKLAANGLSARQIGSALHISPRTASNNLQRAYEKLGINSRRQLADALASPAVRA